jgi:hypothetical protein
MRLAALGPGWATDIFLHRHGAIVIERDDSIVLRTPENPNIHWGNVLLLPRAPAVGELAFWLQRFDAEIAARQSGSDHVAIGISEPAACFELPSRTAAGLQRYDSAAKRALPCSVSNAMPSPSSNSTAPTPTASTPGPAPRSGAASCAASCATTRRWISSSGAWTAR